MPGQARMFCIEYESLVSLDSMKVGNTSFAFQEGLLGNTDLVRCVFTNLS